LLPLRGLVKPVKAFFRADILLNSLRFLPLASSPIDDEDAARSSESWEKVILRPKNGKWRGSKICAIRQLGSLLAEVRNHSGAALSVSFRTRTKLLFERSFAARK